MLTTLAHDFEILKKDLRCSFTKEVAVERDVFAMETRRLQKMIRQLRVIYHKICTENNEVLCLRESISNLTAKIKSSQTNLNDTKSIIVQMKKDIVKAKANIIKAQNDTRNATNKIGELESHSIVLHNMLAREKEEGICIQRQTSVVSEQIRIVRKNNADRAVQAAIAAGMVANDANKSARKSIKKGRKKNKLKEPDKDDLSIASIATTATTTSKATIPQSSPSTPKVPINKEFDEIRVNYLKSIGETTNTFVESAPGSGSPQAKCHPHLRSPTGDHSEYEQLQDKFQKDVTNAENKFMDIMEKLEYGAAKPRKDLEAEAKRLHAELEALKKSQLDVKKWLENVTIELDDKTLKSNEYIIDVKDTKPNVRITSPDKSPKALARKKAQDEDCKKREAEEAARRKAEEEDRKKKEVEEATKRATEDEARRKREVEEAAKRVAEDEARKKKDIEDAAKRSAEDEARKKKDVEDATKRAVEDEARKKRDVEEVAKQAAKEAERRVVEVGEKGASSRGKEPEFFNEKMQVIIKENIKEVLGHLEVISEIVQQKATTSGIAKTSAKEVLEKFDKLDKFK